MEHPQNPLAQAYSERIPEEAGERNRKDGSPVGHHILLGRAEDVAANLMVAEAVVHSVEAQLGVLVEEEEHDAYSVVELRCMLVVEMGERSPLGDQPVEHPYRAEEQCQALALV